MKTESKPVVYRTKVDVVYGYLQKQILAGDMAPSSAINQEQLALELGVSTTPLREALRRLESEGLVRTLPHREVEVTALDPVAMIDMYDVRVVLDAYATGLAAERHNDDEAQLIREATDRLQGTTGDDPLLVNRTFHASIYGASHNAVLVNILDTLWDRSDRYRRSLLPLITDDAGTRDEHLAISEAVLSRDADRASALMKAHVLKARAMIQRLLTTKNGEEET